MGTGLEVIVTPLLPQFRYPPLALRNVVHGGRRSLTAISGVAFSLTMVLLQLGFLEAVKITATNNFEQLDFDVVLLSPRYEQFYGPGFIRLERLRQARCLETVVSASPLYATFNLWTCPPYPLDRPQSESSDERGPSALRRWWLGAKVPRPLQRRELLVLGIDLEKNLFREPIHGRIEASKPLLRLENRVLLNELSHIDFGWQLRDQFKDWELDRQAVTVVGGFPMLRGFAADSAVICSDQNFVKLCSYPSLDVVNFGFLKVRKGTVNETVGRLKTLLPPDVKVLSRAEILARETNHWVHQTSTGELFAFGVLVAMIVAAVVVYQVLSNDVREHLPEYATLKAMGYSHLRLSRVVVTQGLIYTLIAYLIAVVIGTAVYWITQELAGIPMRLTVANLTITLILAIVVGLLSGALTLDKLRSAQPADLF
jgi:putative ABC transport system permease protein